MTPPLLGRINWINHSERPIWWANNLFNVTGAARWAQQSWEPIRLRHLHPFAGTSNGGIYLSGNYIAYYPASTGIDAE